MFRRFNCCIFNHPIPIFCPWINLSCQDGNQIINPIITNSYGYFTNTAGGEIASQGIIPVGFVQGRGSMILPSITTSGAITLSAGTYAITYSANGTIPASGTVSLELELNGVAVSDSIVSATQTASNVASLSKTVVITVPQTSTLELVNASSDAATFSNVSVFVRQI